ncbi:NmrA family NAD(P)-binding protein [Paenibacillus sp. RC67]|uniref:NmrA family NAD(P)-binding protein n=1 Tax=Paenibacillus sp. RC67 TaxID=3039392 RepID=UPI0024AE769F|nr:NmrA family NAD(P)-binding protein [Paenibacillus sp. RC67]
MITIIGATGVIGGALLKRMVELGVPVRALSREPDKLRSQLGEAELSMIEIASADASDTGSLRHAFAGASQLFLAMSNSPRQVELETSIIRTAVEAGVEHIVKISSPVYDSRSPVAIAGWHQEIEGFLSQAGITGTLLRPYAFMQNLLRFAPSIRAQDVFWGCMGDSPCNFIDCRDIADVAAEVLTNREVAGRTYTLTGSETYSYPHIAAKLSFLLNRTIRYVDRSREELLNDLIQYAQMPSWIANHVVEIQTMATVIPEMPTYTVKGLLGRDPRTLDAFLQEQIEQFR